MHRLYDADLRFARAALERAFAYYLFDPNVTHIDFGFRIHDREGYRIEPSLAVRVHVRRKLYGDAFRAFRRRYPERVVDESVLQFPVDVPQAAYRLHQVVAAVPGLQVHSYNRFFVHRPRPSGSVTLHGGISGCNLGLWGAGTLGGIVRDRRTGIPMILSNRHVLHSFNSPWVVQPSTADGGGREQAVALFERDALAEGLDAAVARLLEGKAFSNEQDGIGTVSGVASPYLGQRLVKSGRGSGISRGMVTGIWGRSLQRYDGIRRVVRHIVHIAPLRTAATVSKPGDSGAWWLDERSRRCVALHFAGSDDPEFGLALAMPEVFQLLNIEIPT